jgi:hypothetical protein
LLSAQAAVAVRMAVVAVVAVKFVLLPESL